MKRSIAIIGSGPSALMLAAMLDEKKWEVTLYERNFAPGRKFLVAGDGGFNLTYSEDMGKFITRYTPQNFLEKNLLAFTNADLCNWMEEIGIKTYVGTSKRIFPVKGIKPIDVLNAILKELKKKNVQLKTQHKWKRWNEINELVFTHNKNDFSVKTDVVVFALGGSSWSKTGSDGTWVNLFEEKQVDIIPFQPSNCAYEIKWDKKFLEISEGKFLKNISIKIDDKEKAGELVITKFGIEGGAIYALSPQIRAQLKENKRAKIYIDLKPIFSIDEIRSKLKSKGSRSVGKQLEDELNLSDLQIALLKSILTKEEFLDTKILAQKIKELPLEIVSMAPLDEAISTVGGIALTEVDENFQLKKIKDHYAIGEMLDWDAPTGGYLLQACFSMGYTLAQHLNK